MPTITQGPIQYLPLAKEDKIQRGHIAGLDRPGKFEGGLTPMKDGGTALPRRVIEDKIDPTPLKAVGVISYSSGAGIINIIAGTPIKLEGPIDDFPVRIERNPLSLEDVQKLDINQRTLRGFFDNVKTVMDRMKDLAKMASDPSLASAKREMLNTEFQQLRNQLTSLANGAFGGLDPAVATKLSNFFNRQINAAFPPGASIATAEGAAAALNGLENATGTIADLQTNLVKPKPSVFEMLDMFNKDVAGAMNGSGNPVEAIRAAMQRMTNWFQTGYYEDPAPQAGV